VFDLVNCGPRQRFVVRNASGEAFIVHNSVAHGLNLQAGGHSVCWFSMTFNLEEFIQFNARVWRQGQPSPHVIVHHIAARDTIDAHIDEVIRQKDARQESLFAALVAHARDSRGTVTP
jgi:SNF2 family DNA or RNA helicase